MSSEARSPEMRQALRTLFRLYWTSAGWRRLDWGSVPPSEIAHAKKLGVLVDEALADHDGTGVRAKRAVAATDRTAVANAFVVSLRSRHLELRSALGSFALLQHFFEHDRPAERGMCPVCGLYGNTGRMTEFSVLNFERFKWGGVRHLHPDYAAFDLEEFAKLSPSEPSAEDVQCLRALLEAIGGVPSNTTSAVLEKYLGKVLQSNKGERDVLVGILGICGILGTARHPGFVTRYVDHCDRQTPNRHYVDMAYPACWWTGSDGICQSAVDYWFGHLM